MKQILLMLLFSIYLQGNCYAQKQYAITTNGDRVTLYENNTWEYTDKNETKSETQINNFTSTSKSTNQTNKSTITSNKKTPKKKISSSRKYYTGPRGGCYYINSNGNKVYVDRSLCN